MKIFIAIIILLIAIQKGGQVPSSSDVSKDITGFINSNNLENCPICCQEILENFSQTICCQKIFHFKCLNDWIILPKKCPLCRQHPFEKCKICLGYLNVDATNVKCCKSQFHKKCLDEWFKKKFYTCPNCKKHLITVCKECNQDVIMNIAVAECCKTQLHQECLDKWLTNSIRCHLCEGDLISVVDV
ncbi:uncharacterized protein LOC126897396 isoform X3 [Daktulosphaira vitifoliae]|uniref:uncharacterized protein LOC126897396 isoform X3 n=1 Tax=Daktulosphaira vitifoliae TaxID=58002 RepID=UPI0021A9A3FF|nr:uncharacterized protein LOC126897396 isoform X3 [Daktulosphaira vitifoliae]